MTHYKSIHDFCSHIINDLTPVYNISSKFLWVYKKELILNLQNIDTYDFDAYNIPKKFPIELNYKIDKHGIKSSIVISEYKDFVLFLNKFDDFTRFHLFWQYRIHTMTYFTLDILIQDNSVSDSYLYQYIIRKNKWRFLGNKIPQKVYEFINKYLLEYEGYIELLFNCTGIVKRIVLKRGNSIFYPFKTILMCSDERAKHIKYDVKIDYGKDMNYLLMK